MIKGIQIALAILVYSLLSGITGTVDATSPSIATDTKRIPCTLPSYALVSSLKYGNHLQKSNGYVSFVPAIFTAPKPVNGAMTGVIGAEVVTPTESPSSSLSTITPTVSPSAPISEYPVESTSGLSSEKLFAMVNSHRAKVGLSPLQTDSTLSQVATARAPELHSEIYVNGNMHAGFHTKSLPYRATENMISQNTEEEALQWWLNSGVHRGAIEGNYTHASVACDGKNCAMIFAEISPTPEQ